LSKSPEKLVKPNIDKVQTVESLNQPYQDTVLKLQVNVEELASNSSELYSFGKAMGIYAHQVMQQVNPEMLPTEHLTTFSNAKV
jgi:hypothetical protein